MKGQQRCKSPCCHGGSKANEAVEVQRFNVSMEVQRFNAAMEVQRSNEEALGFGRDGFFAVVD